MTGLSSPAAGSLAVVLLAAVLAAAAALANLVNNLPAVLVLLPALAAGLR